MALDRKIAVVLFNLGGPDSAASIEPFLKNFFTDPNIIRLPWPFRWALARLIAYKRSRREAGESYGMIGGRSPLLENTRAQAEALQAELSAGGDANYQVFVSMRYWHPMAEEVVKDVKAFAPDKIILLPLYPQYSTTTTRSSFQVWQKEAKKAGLDKPVSLVCCYPENDAFIEASAALIRPIWQEAVEQAAKEGTKPPRLLFSAHGLPESIIKDGDPYQWQCEQTVRAISEKLELAPESQLLCYQSRVGRQKWIGPDTEGEVHRAGAEGVPLVIYPLAFVNEHVETLVELDEEYRLLAQEEGVPAFYRVATVGINKIFIQGLAKIVRARLNKATIASDQNKRICPTGFQRCCMQQFKGAEQVL